jgi:hypothetical protein
MAKKKISGLPAGSALNGTELVPIVQTGTTKRITTQDIANLGNSSGVEGSGTINTLPKFTASSTIGDSKFFDDGTNQGTETTTAVNRFIMSANASIAKIFSFRSANLPRWAFRVDGTESGANAGADLAIRRYNDAGTYVDSPIFIKRSSGNIGIGTITAGSKFQVTTTTNENVAIGSLSSIPTGRTLILQTTALGGSIETYSSLTAGYIPLLLNPSGANVLIGTTTSSTFLLDVNGTARVQGKLTKVQTTATQISSELANSNTQGTAQLQKIVRYYPQIALATKLIIPFVSQSNLNSTTFVRIIGHSASFNSNVPQGFSAEFAVGHLTSLSNLSTLNSSGNIASIAINGMNIEITFTLPYTLSTVNGLFTTIEYMTNNVSWSINVANITMN